jgi:cytochrome b6-f complex iron-sulfur subunit
MSEEAEQEEKLNRYVDHLLNERHSELPEGLSHRELGLYMLAAQMKGMQPEADEPREDFLHELQAAVERESQRTRNRLPASARQQSGLRRRRLLRAAGVLAAGVIVGAAIDHEIGSVHPALPPLVRENGRWYLLAETAALPVGSVRRFSAGGIDGYLFNEGGHYRAVSAICTHMGCHIDWEQADERFHCLCHAAQFHADGTVAAGVSAVPLPVIPLREEAGKVYAWGTQQTTWG